MSAERSSAARALLALLVLAAVASAVAPLLQPVDDPDLFWHLRTGEWIWRAKGLPADYLFVDAPPDTLAATQRFQMTSYWLSQVALHLVHAAGGMRAITALRFVLIGALLALLLPRRRDGDALVFAGLLVFAAIALSTFPQERPQYFSFVFAGVLLWLLEGLRDAASGAALLRRAVAVPLLLFLWAQCHGGYVVGLGFVGVMLLVETLKRLSPRLGPLPPERWRVLLLSGAAAIPAAMVNPNGWYALRIAQLPDWQTQFVTEYWSSIRVYRVAGDPGVLAYWILLVLAATGFALNWRRVDPTQVALAAVAGAFSFAHIRFIPFFIVAALPAACRALSAPRLVKPARAAVVAAALAAGGAFLVPAVSRVPEAARIGEVNDRNFPVAAAAFVERAGLRGNVFGLYDWGGYLLWRLAPANVFIDGRNADRGRHEAYRAILAGQRGPWGGAWKGAFATHGIHLAVVRFFDVFTGEFSGLVDNLLADPGWAPVFASHTTVVFAESTPDNDDAVRRHALPKAQFYAQLADYCAGIIAGTPRFVPAYLAQAELFLRLGDRGAALRSCLAALEVDPGNRRARSLAEFLSAGAR